MAEVNWGNQFEFVDVAQLMVCDPSVNPNADRDIREGRYGTVADLRRRMTFEKLRGLLTDVFYSMKTSEIDFYAHQFRPVLRFIESATSRLLIADEVGLGKTIEAGLIWTEWQAREKARRLLVVCTPMTLPKWLRELQDRFQIAAEATDAQHLLELLERFDRKGPGLSFALVTSYHSIRPFKTEIEQLQSLQEGGEEPKIMRGSRLSARVNLLHKLRNWEAPEPFLDMVVFDEAHWMKNTGSSTYFAGEIFSSRAGAAVSLSATPIHNNTRDLYALLRLVDPEVFRDQFGFELLRQQNLPIVQLQNALASSKWKPQDIKSLVDRLYSEEAKKRINKELAEFDGTPRKRVEIRHSVERLNLLGNFINRTRKRDVIENRVIRQPVTFPVTLTNKESSFYKAVLALVRKEVLRRGDRVTSFHLIHPALRMSSSLPVVAEAVRDGKWGGFQEIEQLAEDFQMEFDSESTGPKFSSDELRRLATYDFEEHDSKYNAFRKALRLIVANSKLESDKGDEIEISPKDKVIVFAFFKGTIAYLKKRLDADGFMSVSVTGDIKDRDERDRILQKFAFDENRILLCSEIGAEGVDLQFARVVVNYDLPWNPMRVEQRIGRIDRIGQRSSNIVIINFHVRDTIDGSIFSHLYAKIGVFEGTIGALEGILGEEVAKLTAEIFREDLTPQQVALRAEQTANAVCQRAVMEEQLEDSTGALIAFQDLLSEQIGESQRLGRFIKPSELRLHTEDFFASKYRGNAACLLVWDNPYRDCVELKMSYEALTDFETFCQLQEYAWPDGFSRNTRSANLTFDPTVHQRHKGQCRRLVLVTHLHPLFRWITKQNEQANNQWHKVSAIRLSGQNFESGQYFYLIYRMTLEGITRRDAFHYAIKHLVSGEVKIGKHAEALLNLALECGESAFPQQTEDHSGNLTELRQALATQFESAQRIFRDDQLQKLEIRKQQVNSHFNRRIEAQRRRIATAELANLEAKRGVAGFRRQLANLETQRDHQLTKLRDKLNALTEGFSEVACGLIEVVP